MEASPGQEEPREQQHAAELIQRNYRGYRERRQLQGLGLDASTRWAEAVRDARWRNITRPKPRAEQLSAHSHVSTPARQTWKRAGEIARRAGADEPPDGLPSEGGDGLEWEGRKTAKMMDLQYFLEMVDQKHRYGSNLRAYHEQWKKSDTHENFFYWLDAGEGRKWEHPTVSRDRLDKERVRYLSREERLHYLVTIDEDGRLCWAKNGERISSTPQYKDSVHGIVPVDDPTPVFGPNGKMLDGQRKTIRRPSLASSLSSRDESESESEAEAEAEAEAEHYLNEDLHRARGLAKIKHVSAATVLNHLLRSSVKPNSWIFVADTSFRLYIGIKQSGTFQHSSFLQGARISAAGLVKIKDGQLRRLSPLSGHYRPPTKNFRAFVHSMKHSGVDMSRVSISRSYAVLVGLEAYVHTRRTLKHGLGHVRDAESKLLHPDQHRRRAEEQRDKSESAQKERVLLAREAHRLHAQKMDQSLPLRLWSRLRRGAGDGDRDDVPQSRETLRSRSGEDVESSIAPEGTRETGGEAAGGKHKP